MLHPRIVRAATFELTVRNLIGFEHFDSKLQTHDICLAEPDKVVLIKFSKLVYIHMRSLLNYWLGEKCEVERVYICHRGRVFPAKAAADARSAASSVCVFSLSPRLPQFGSQRAEAKWKVTLGRRRCIKHSGSLSEKHALAGYTRCILHFFTKLFTKLHWGTPCLRERRESWSILEPKCIDFDKRA